MTNPVYQLELRKRREEAVARRNQIERDDISRSVGALGGVVVGSEDAPEEEKNRDNTLIFLAGSHGGFVIQKPNTQVVGQPGAIVDRLWTIDTGDQVTRIQGMHFRCIDPKGDNTDALVLVKAGSTCIFTDCTFELEGVVMNGMVDIESGGKVSLISCSFGPAQTAGNPCHNQGVPANAYVIGCSNKTGQLHQNTTLIGETT